MKIILIAFLITFCSLAAFPGPGVVPTWERVCTYSDNSGLTAGTSDLILYGGMDVRNDGSHDGTITSDRVYTDYLEATFFSPNAISVQSLTANTISVTGDITSSGTGTFAYLLSILGITSNAITADHTLIGYETVIGGINTNAITSNKVITGSLNSNVIVATTGDFTNISSNTITVVTGDFTYVSADTMEADVICSGVVNATQSITTGAFFYGDITKTTGYHATSEVFIEGTQGVQVSGNTIEFRNAGVSRSGDIIFIDCPDGSGGGGAALTNDIIGIDKYFKLSEVDRTTVPTPGTGEVNIFNDNISHQPALKDWLGRVYGFMLQSLEDIPFLFNIGTYTDYTYSGTYGTNWNASSTSIFNVNDLSNPSGSPYALTLSTKVSRLVDISSITPNSFVVDYGPYDLGGIQFGLVGNAGTIYYCYLFDKVLDATGDTATDFLTWLTADNTGVTATVSTWVCDNSNNTKMNYISINKKNFEYYVTITTGGTVAGYVTTTGIGRATDHNFVRGPASLSIDGTNAQLGYYNNVGTEATPVVKSGIATGTTYYCKVKLNEFAYYDATHDTAEIKVWMNTTGVFTGAEDARYDSLIPRSVSTWYAHAGGFAAYPSHTISNFYLKQYYADATGTWTEAQYNNTSKNTEAQVNTAIDNFKTDTGSTVFGPYVSFTSGTTGEIESINVGY